MYSHVVFTIFNGFISSRIYTESQYTARYNLFFYSVFIRSLVFVVCIDALSMNASAKLKIVSHHC